MNTFLILVVSLLWSINTSNRKPLYTSNRKTEIRYFSYCCKVGLYSSVIVLPIQQYNTKLTGGKYSEDLTQKYLAEI